MQTAGDSLPWVLVLDLLSGSAPESGLFAPAGNVRCQAVRVHSQEEFVQALPNKRWSLLIALCTKNAASVVEAVLPSCTKIDKGRVPFILAAEAEEVSDRLQWMRLGVSDCVAVGQAELLQRIASRELGRPASLVLNTAEKHSRRTATSDRQQDGKQAPVVQAAPCDQGQAIQEKVQRAWDNKRFQLMFQAVTGLKNSQDDEHYDVLLRLLEPDGQVLNAGRFIDHVDLMPVAVQIDKWVIWNSLRRLKVHHRQCSSTRLFIHLSSASLQDKRLPAWLKFLFEKAGAEPSSLIFQLAEEQIVRFPQQVLILLRQLRTVGCGTSLCHFDGSAQAMHIVRDFPTDYIKLAGSLTRTLADDPEQERVLRQLIDQLRVMGRKTIVPWVENPSVMTRVWRTGTHYVQGNFLQQPVIEMDYDFRTGC